MTNPVDPETGAPLHRDVRPFTLTYQGASITVDMPGWYGDRPHEGVFDPQDMKVSDRALNRLKARIEGLLEPEEIRRIRKKLRLTQEAAGELIGGGPRAFQKYESGDALPNERSALRRRRDRLALTPARQGEDLDSGSNVGAALLHQCAAMRCAYCAYGLRAEVNRPRQWDDRRGGL